MVVSYNLISLANTIAGSWVGCTLLQIANERQDVACVLS
jgi:hypothetical protein